jgi:hypothetical protein
LVDVIVKMKYRILVVYKNKEFELFIVVVVYLNNADVSSSPHHAALIFTNRQRD